MLNQPQDPAFMRRAIALAMRGRGAVEPNPMVGCVIVKNGRIIGEGFHRRFGMPHAEPEALAACAESPAGATAYVTLEPCCHTDKKTPPCVPALVRAQLACVVVGCLDPNPRVDGKGLEQLRAAGIEVIAPFLEADCRQLIAPFIKSTLHRRPYVTLKWAQTADGKVAGPGGQRLQISNASATRAIHQLRARSDAIMVGIGTVLVDDPLLTARDVENPRPRRLWRVVLDTHLRLPPQSRLAQSNSDDVLVFCSSESYARSHASPLRNRVQIIPVATDADGRLSLNAVLDEMGARLAPFGPHLIVEPGPTLARSFLDANLADRLWVIRSRRAIDDPTAPAACAVPYPAVASTDLDGDGLTEYLNPSSSVFFAAARSADLLLAARADPEA